MEVVKELEARLAELESELQRARANVDEWTAAASSLARSAAEARANNQGAGKGFMGALLGSKVRKALRAGAAASNAAIAKMSQKSDQTFRQEKLLRRLTSSKFKAILLASRLRSVRRKPLAAA